MVSWPAVPLLKPFRALRYDEGTAGPLDDLVAPPYDVITAESRDRLLARAPCNAARAVPPEIELRGQTVDEAMPTIEQYLDEAFRAGLPWTRIIHGKGTGTLRRQVRDLLAKHPLVKSYEQAPPQEGGEGVTIAHLAV